MQERKDGTCRISPVAEAKEDIKENHQHRNDEHTTLTVKNKKKATEYSSQVASKLLILQHHVFSKQLFSLRGGRPIIAAAATAARHRSAARRIAFLGADLDLPSLRPLCFPARLAGLWAFLLSNLH
jgi:hypothetical protein